MNEEQAKAEALEKLAERNAERVRPVYIGKGWEIWADFYTWMVGISIAKPAIIVAIGPFEIVIYL